MDVDYSSCEILPEQVAGINDSNTFNITNYCSTNSTDLSTEVTVLYDVPVSIIVLLSIFYGTISVMAVVGNTLVIWIVTSSRRMHNVTNCYIANLALADIVIGLFSIPFQFQAALLQRWNLPAVMCPFCPFVQVLSVNVSIFTLTAIAIDRHRAILSPLRATPTKFRAKLLIATIWIAAFTLATPMAIALRVQVIEYTDGAGYKLEKPFCHNLRLPEQTMFLYRVTLLFVQYVVPVIIITVVYVRMALRLWGSHAPGNAQDSRDANLMRNKKKGTMNKCYPNDNITSIENNFSSNFRYCGTFQTLQDSFIVRNLIYLKFATSRH
ncbi:RYamide receptor-like isoform X2 [Daktulosphaira vitifoliae]|uniref:RYamide receptor-like isoform X2 n=1 Tax=Daktulosphaira vitifoliae TaxID=58002 RepID=UPI0021A9EB54|nr:RYamide receptor-like isoform X2 [Daktulosphaira vitifoliae]